MPLLYDPQVHDVEIVHAQFNRLIQELLKGTIARNTFQPWEIEILLDVQGADLGRASEKEVLKRYQKAVHRAYEKGAKMPMKLSEYLDGLKSKRNSASDTGSPTSGSDLERLKSAVA
jgi:hypothetical protein